MNQVVLTGILLVILENGLVPWLVPPAWSERLLPHLTFVLTVYVASFAGRHQAFFFGLGFGLLGDMLYYGDLIGPFGFGMGLVGYLAGLLQERGQPSLASIIGLTALGSIALNTVVYLIYRLFRLTTWSYGFSFYWFMAPSFMLEVLIALALYVPVRRWLLKSVPPARDDVPS